jgi:hypothetical protein
VQNKQKPRRLKKKTTKPKISFTTKYGANGILSALESIPKGFDEPS